MASRTRRRAASAPPPRVGPAALAERGRGDDDPASGRIEREYDHVLVGRVGTELPVQPDPAEVDEVRWVSPAELRSDLVSAPDRYAPWLPGVLALLPDTPLS